MEVRKVVTSLVSSFVGTMCRQAPRSTRGRHPPNPLSGIEEWARAVWESWKDEHGRIAALLKGLYRMRESQPSSGRTLDRAKSSYFAITIVEGPGVGAKVMDENPASRSQDS